MSAAVELATILGNRRWCYRVEPFPHVVADQVFQPAAYAEFEQAFAARLEGSVPQERFSRNLPGYDAWGVTFSPRTSGPLSVFLSRPWHDLIAKAFGVDATGYISGGLHHHERSSADGTIHNDLNPGWFADYDADDGIIISDQTVCDYRTGETHDGAVAIRETVRAVAVLFYLNNPEWECGSGGVTGLYHSGRDDIHLPAAVVPPRNNSLLAFECTPDSHHAFLSNGRQPRNSLIVWLHREKRAAVARWGGRSIIYW
jgi:hypothetical protein